MSRCIHQWVNTGFTSMTMACKKCGQSMDDFNSEVKNLRKKLDDEQDNFNYEVQPTVSIVKKIPILRGMTEIMPLLGLLKNTGCIIAGGFGRVCCGPNPEIKAGDIDIYPQNEKSFNRLIEELKEKGFKDYDSKCCVEMEKPRYKEIFNAEHARWASIPLPIQIVKCHKINLSEKRSGMTREEYAKQILDSFDLANVRVAILDHETAFADSNFWNSEISRRAEFLGYRTKAMLLSRVNKYAKKKYSIDPKQLNRLVIKKEEHFPQFANNLNLAIRGKMVTWEKKRIEDSGAFDRDLGKITV